jgi:hypothetical protein
MKSLPTALEIAQARVESLEAIPPMTDPMGKHWGQPERREILVDETHAVMTSRTFRALHEYSSSQPTGVYDGKMWKRHDGVYDCEFRSSGGIPTWLLCWYGPSSKGPGWCQTNTRIILLTDGPATIGC